MHFHDYSLIFTSVRKIINILPISHEDQNQTCLTTMLSLGWLWYRVLVHMEMRSLDKLLKVEYVLGIKKCHIRQGLPIQCFRRWEASRKLASGQEDHEY
jgi:hypothetical protein